MIDATQKQILAILFAGGEAVEIGRIASAIGMDPEMVLKSVLPIRDALEDAGFPFEVLRLGDKLQLCTAGEFAPVIREALELRRNMPLSQAAMEVLAVVAYNQPVTRSFIEQVRGVDSTGVVNSLLEKQLIEEAGRLDLPGRPITYRTASAFLRCFNLESLDDLPSISMPSGEETQGDGFLEDQIRFDFEEDGGNIPEE
jgi:segregation and condensation protein B